APRYALTHAGYQTAAGFTLSETAVDGRTVGVVESDSPAARAGLKAGDVIVKVIPGSLPSAERAINSFVDLHNALVTQWPRGENSLILQVRRGNEEVSVGPFSPRTLGLHPTQLYEAISMALVFFLIATYFPFRRRPGEVMAVLMFCYGLQRYFNEMLRND